MATATALWRYPVKSFRGEPRRELELDARGVTGDRLWALLDSDGKIASGKTTRRFRAVRGLLQHAATLEPDGSPILHLSDGRVLPPDATLAEELAGPGWRFAFERDVSYLDAAPVHLVTTATLAELGTAAGFPVEVDRLRPNILVDAGNVREESWAGKELEVGTALLAVRGSAERCVMVNDAQLGLPRRSQLLRTIGRWNGLCAGVYADVIRPGRIGVGDAVRVRDGYGADVPARP